MDHDITRKLSVAMTDEEYHRHPAISNTGLGYLLRSAAHFQQSSNIFKDTAELRFGTLFHSALLTPETFKQNLLVAPRFGDLRFAKNKEARERFLSESQGRIVVELDDMKKIERMVEAVQKHKRASKLLENTQNELAFIWHDEEFDLDCRCKPDILRQDKMIVDLKTTKDASRKEFGRSAFNYGYHRQAAFYLRGLTAVTGHKYDKFLIIAVEKEPPFGVTVHHVTDDHIELGMKDVERALRTLKEAKESNTWGCYDEEIEPLKLPNYAWGL